VNKGSAIFWHATAMKPNIRSARLAAMGKRELMHIRTEISDTVQGSRRGVGYDSDVRVVEPFPGRMIGVELEPSTAKAEMFWLS
jgi:hypothetical protein